MLRELARAADDVASRGEQHWTIGHELAKKLTSNDRTMSEEEVALVRGLEMMIGLPGDEHPRLWWLDSDSSSESHSTKWLPVWASVVQHARHPAIIAHLSDLLWTARHGSPAHVHARRAAEAYLSAWSGERTGQEIGRAQLRALDLAIQINDQSLRKTAETAVLDAAKKAIDAGDLSQAVWTLTGCTSKKLSSGGRTAFFRLLREAWQRVNDPDIGERIAKALLGDADAEEREALASRVVALRRARAEREEGFGRLIQLREALRVAEELGHPAHEEILHEIETLDSDDLFQAVRSEATIPRSAISDFCARIVGNDNLEGALIRFSFNLAITPESLAAVREQTRVGIRHCVTSQRIGEANSVVTSTETFRADAGVDLVELAVDRDVRATAGYAAQVTAFTFLVPALHQLLDSYRPWSVDELRNLLGRGVADAVVADALARALHHFDAQDYDEAVHVALPRVERLIRHVARLSGVATTRRPTARVGGIRGLGEILPDLRGDQGVTPRLPEPFLTASELMLVDPDSLNLRNNVLHGISDEIRSTDAALVLQLGVAMALVLRQQDPAGPGPADP